MLLLNYLLVVLPSILYLGCNSADSKELIKELSYKNITATGDMHENRAAHTAVLLKNGKVLITGGFRKGLDGRSQLYSKTSEIFDPQSNSFTMSEDMDVERCAHTATLLTDGNVLVTGGTDGHNLASTRLYNAESGKWEILANMKTARSGHEAVLLPDNQVLIIGGSGNAATFAELFDYKAKKFLKVISAPINLNGPSVILLKNGKILVAGGDMDDQPTEYALLYDLKTGTFSPAAKMGIVRHKSSVALLPGGNALIIGGSNNRDWKGKYTSTEVYDVKTNVFSKGPYLNFERFKLMNAVVILKDGSILVTGGDKHIEILRPGALHFETIGELPQPLYYSTSTLLPNGKALITGGYGNDVQASNKGSVFSTW